MDLRTFISETLTQIITGIEDAQRQLSQRDEGSNGAVSPDGSVGYIGDHDFVNFDVAVVASSSEQNDSGGKASIRVIGFEIGGKAADQRTAAEQVTSRISFKIPITPPSLRDERPRL